MHKKSTFRCLAIAAFVSSLGMTTIPSAGALEPPSASDVVSQTAQELTNAGIPVDPAVTNGAVAAAQNAEQAAQNAQQAVDSAVNSLSAATPVAPTVPEAPAVPNFTQDIPPEQAMPEVVPRISSELSSAINSVTGSSQQPAPSPSVPETAVTPETPNAPTVPNVPSVPANALESAANIVNTEKSENKTQDTEVGADSDEYEPGRTETPPLVRRYIDAQIKEATAPSERAISSVSQLFENINKLRDGSLSSTEYSANKLMQRPNINRNAAEFEAQVAQFESQVAQLASSGVNYAGEPYKEVGKDYRPIIDGPNRSPSLWRSGSPQTGYCIGCRAPGLTSQTPRWPRCLPNGRAIPCMAHPPRYTSAIISCALLPPPATISRAARLLSPPGTVVIPGIR